MVAIKAHNITIRGNTFLAGKESYPELPTVYGGLSITWGASSCIDHPEVSRAQASLWVPKTHEDQIPELGDIIYISGGNTTAGVTPSAQLFAGKIESVKLKDNYKEGPDAGYVVDIIAADALAEAARLRLSDAPWPLEDAYARQIRIAELATRTGVEFLPGVEVEQGYIDALNTDVIYRDVDSYPALEAFQRTVMASGHTVASVNNVVQPSVALRPPSVLSADLTGVNTLYTWLGTSGLSRSVEKTSGVITRTNEATNPTSDTYDNLTSSAGTGGTLIYTRYKTKTRNGNTRTILKWTKASTGGNPRVTYTEPSVSGASGSKVSLGVWLQIDTATPWMASSRNVQLVGTLYNGATAVGTKTSSTYTIQSLIDSNSGWRYLTLDGVTATGAYTSVKLDINLTGNMPINSYVGIDGVLIEKTSTAGQYFDGDSLAPEANIISEQTAGIPTFDASIIEDDSFQIDTSRVVNEVKVEMKIIQSSIWPPGPPPQNDFDQIYTDVEGTRRTTPQSRALSTDWLVRDPHMQGVSPASPMVAKGQLLLAGQSTAKWRLSSALVPILSKVPEQIELINVLQESTRFGAMIRIDNGPALVDKYMRVHGGTLVIGDATRLELDLEPVEYSAPIPLTENTLAVDPIASNFRIANFHNISSHDLRSIGAR